MTDMLSARLSKAETKRLAAHHPQLASSGDPPSVLAIVLENDRELALLELLLDHARRYAADQKASVQALLDALLPASALRVSPGLLRQVERNAMAQQALASEYGLLDGRQLARLQRSTAANPASVGYRLRTGGRVFAVEVGGDVRYPAFQFGQDGKPLPVIADILAAIDHSVDGWELALWFTGDNAWLGGARPVDALSGTDEDRQAVVRAARHLAAEVRPAGSPQQPAQAS